MTRRRHDRAARRAHGLKLMSIGFFLDENAAVMWRGPMLHRALEQFLTDVHWGELDFLLVDMPPGTGDVAISLGQLLPRAEAIVVTTPQPAGAGRRGARGAHGPEDEHATARRDREHERGRVRLGWRSAARRVARDVAARHGAARRSAARVGATSASRSSRRSPTLQPAARSWRSPKRCSPPRASRESASSRSCRSFLGKGRPAPFSDAFEAAAAVHAGRNRRRRRTSEGRCHRHRHP